MKTVGEVLHKVFIWDPKKGPIEIGIIAKTLDPMESTVYIGISGDPKYGTQGQFLVRSNKIEECENALVERYLRSKVEEYKNRIVGLPARIIWSDGRILVLLRKEEDDKFFVIHWQKREEYEKFMTALAKVGGLEAMVTKTRKPLEEGEITIPPSPYVLKFAEPIAQSEVIWNGHKCCYELKQS
jgi:hypothetical protein